METKFIDGLFIKSPHEKSPEFVKFKCSVLTDKFIKFLNENTNAKGFVNFDVLESKGKTLYAKLDSWQPEKKVEQKPEQIEEEVNVENIPF